MTRVLAWGALALQALFTVIWLVAGAIEPHYDAATSFVSEMAARTAAHPWLVGAGIAAYGTSFLLLAAALRRVLPSARAAAVLFAIAGVAGLVAAFSRLDCIATVSATCRHAVHAGAVSGEFWAHEVATWVAELALVATPFALARALWSRPSGVAALLAGLVGLVEGLVVNALEWNFAPGAGYAQRVGLLIVAAWVVIVGWAILLAVRRPEPPTALTPMRARRFFERAWTGQGQVVLRPAWLWRRVPLRFACTRDLEVVSDELVVFSDRAEFAGGYVHAQRRFCWMQAPDRVEVTAADLPDGAVVTLEDAGYRIEPYRLLTRVGPFAFALDARDEHRADGDALEDTIDLRWLGLPAARVQLRVTPVAPATPARGDALTSAR